MDGGTTFDELVASQHQREPVAMARAAGKIETIKPDPDVPRLLRAAQAARTVGQRVVWLHRTASAWARPIATVAACRKGCSACCFQAVSISQTEAELIGRTIGQRPTDVVDPVHPHASFDLADREAGEERLRASWAGSPCPFLSEGECSIYDVRPFACRTLINLDDDPLLCQIVPSRPASVPYANAQYLLAMWAMAQPNAKLADIREFFPSESPVASA
ncbi:YkgJ family cysteine cluster protein [Variovorax sp. LT1P1]|uniref:YkgJ family cysteine cluster protein n=1 Tax=Variovorax sp. LT1P1 TaxID=3443730 RepID=UPI003F44725A